MSDSPTDFKKITLAKGEFDFNRPEVMIDKNGNKTLLISLRMPFEMSHVQREALRSEMAARHFIPYTGRTASEYLQEDFFTTDQAIISHYVQLFQQAGIKVQERTIKEFLPRQTPNSVTELEEDLTESVRMLAMLPERRPWQERSKPSGQNKRS